MGARAPVRLLAGSGRKGAAEGFGLLCSVFVLYADAICTAGIVLRMIFAGDDIAADAVQTRFFVVHKIHDEYLPISNSGCSGVL